MAAAPTEVDHAFRTPRRGRLTSATAMGGGRTSRSRAVLALHRLLLRTARGPFGRVWARAYRWLARGVCAFVARGVAEPAFYLRGSVAAGDYLPGLSDLDTVVVFGDGPGAEAACERARRRWERLSRMVPPIGLLVDGPMVYRQSELRRLAGRSALTYGLDGPGPAAAQPSAYFGRHASFDWLRKLERPGLYGPAADWSRIGGPDRRPLDKPRERGHERLAGWLELLHLWRWAFPACVDPRGPRTASLCVTLVCEPARIWLLLARGERAAGQEDVLRRAVERMPDEAPAFERALRLRRALARSPEPPLADAVGTLLRISARIAETLSFELDAAQRTEVRLRGGTADELILAGGEPGGGAGQGGGSPGIGILPLADWRALACPLAPDEALAPVGGDPADAAVLAAAGGRRSGPYPALRSGPVMLLPAAAWWRSRLRAIKFEGSDPVSFALADGQPCARFPVVRGWSAEDTSARAVAEHRAWLGGQPGRWAIRDTHLGGPRLAMLWSAARAALFRESLDEGEPELCLTVAETARAVSDRAAGVRTLAEEAIEAYRTFAERREQPSPGLVAALRSAVLELPGLRGVARAGGLSGR